jgi:hypothetical protein
MDPTEPKKPPRRRWFQYSIRSILVLTTLATVALAAWSTSLHRIGCAHRR